MKFITVLLLLVGSFVLNCEGNTQSIPLQLLEKPRISNEALQEFNYESESMADEIPHVLEEVPDVKEIIKRSTDFKAGCSVGSTKLASPEPLFLKPTTSTIWPVSATGDLVFSAGENLELYCPSTYVYPPKKYKSETATCVSGTTFKIDGSEYDLTKVLCSSWPIPTAHKTGASCNGGIMVESGFDVGTRFVKQLDICFNENLNVTRYVYHTLGPSSIYYQKNNLRVNFKRHDFFQQNIETLYLKKTQFKTINVELNIDAKKYINTRPNLYLARGHLAAMTDFVYGNEQRGTFTFFNVAPQWQDFNAGNWKTFEDNTRTWVSATKRYVDCYTGVYGVTTLPNRKGAQTHLYLEVTANKKSFIPIPMLFFRVIIEPSTKRGVVLIGVNNPHLTLAEIKNDYILCPDVSDKITWLKWKKTDIKAGYSYACDVNEFAKKNPNLPEFDVTSLLY